MILVYVVITTTLLTLMMGIMCQVFLVSIYKELGLVINRLAHGCSYSTVVHSEVSY